MPIYKIAFMEDWMGAEKAGLFEGSAKDKEDGFLHFSTAEQLRETLRLHYSRTDRMLVIAAVRSEALGEELKWEPSRNGENFPHLYGALPMTAVEKTLATHYTSLAGNNFAKLDDFIAQ